MHKSSKMAAAMVLVAAPSMAYAGTLSVGNTVRTLSDTPRVSSNSRVSAPNARNSTLVLPSSRVVAATPEAKVIPLDRPRAKTLQESTASVSAASSAVEDRSPVAFGIQWHTQSGVVNPQEIVSRARNLRHSGLPIVHLWQSNKDLVALGLSPHGVPGVYFTQGMSK
jgi:hypothetical protein